MTSDSERIVDLYERHALAWNADRTRGSSRLMERHWLDAFAALIPAGGSVLDIGCGAGEPIAGYLIGRGFAVTGLDSSATLIALGRDRFPGHTWHVGDMRTLSLGRRFDGVLAWDSFFHLSCDDQRRMFQVFRDHAAAGAPLLFTSGPAHGEAIGSYQGEPLYHASLDGAEYRRLLGDNGFDVVDHKVEDPDCGRHTVWLARSKRAG